MSKDLANNNDEYQYVEQSETFTIWKNNTDKTATFRLLTSETRRGVYNGRDRLMDPKEANYCKGTVFITVSIPPGGKKELPKQYDRAIRKWDDKTQMVVGGLCPWLTKEGEKDVIIHKSLDYKTDVQMEQANNIIAGLKKQKELEEALAILKAQNEASKTPKK